MKKNAQMALILLFITVLSGGCANNNEPLPAADTDLTYEYTPSVIKYSEFPASYDELPSGGEVTYEEFQVPIQNQILDSPPPAVNIPPWQVGYIENLEYLHTQPPYSYEIIVPFGRYNWIHIRDGIIIANKIVYDESHVFGEFGLDSHRYYSALLNLCGEYIVPLGTFNRIIQVGDNFVVVQDNHGNSGVYDFTGSPIIPIGKYQSIGEVRNNTVVVRNHEGRGVVDLDGNTIIPFGVYSNINILSAGESSNPLFVTVEQTDTGTERRGIRDLEGNVIIAPGQFYSFRNVSGSRYGMLVLGQFSSSGSESADEAALFNIETGEIVSFSIQGLGSRDGLRIIKSGYAMTGHGIFNFSGERISPENLFFHTRHCSERRFFSVSQDNIAGIYDLHTNEVFWLGSDLRIENISYPLVLVGMLDSSREVTVVRFGAVLDFYGQEVVPFGAHGVTYRILGENRFLVRVDISGHGQAFIVINAAGQEIIPPGRTGLLTPIDGTDFLWFEFNDHCGEATDVVDLDGRSIFPQHEYLFLGHWGVQIDSCTGLTNNHFFLVEDSNRNKALVRLIQ